jgi:hypothetical protein
MRILFLHSLSLLESFGSTPLLMPRLRRELIFAASYDPRHARLVGDELKHRLAGRTAKVCPRPCKFLDLVYSQDRGRRCGSCFSTRLACSNPSDLAASYDPRHARLVGDELKHRLAGRTAKVCPDAHEIGDLQSASGNLFPPSAAAQPDPRPGPSGRQAAWATSSNIGSLAERQKFVQTHMSDIDNGKSFALCFGRLQR